VREDVQENELEWPLERLRRDRTDAAFALWPLLLHPNRWMLRRVDRIEFLHERAVRRQTSVDLQLPTLPEGASIPLYPLALLRKGPLKAFDLVDESGRSLSMLTREENVLIAEVLLVRLAHAVVRQSGGSRLESAVAEDLRAIPDADIKAARAAYERFAESETSSEQRAAIWDAPALETLVTQLTENFLLLVPAREPASRRIIKFSYEDEPIHSGRGSTGWKARVRRMPQFMGLVPVVFALPVVGLFRAQSYHAEVEAPQGLVIASATLGFDADKPLDSARGARRVHLSAPHQTARTPPARLRVTFVLDPSGFVLTTVWITAVTALLLIVGRTFAATGVHVRSDVGAPVVVALPALFATYLAQAGEHPLERRLVGGLRLVVATTALVSFAAAASLAVSLSHSQRTFLWDLLGVLQVALVLVALRARRVARVGALSDRSS
jgi:hypothetical protein